MNFKVGDKVIYCGRSKIKILHKGLKGVVRSVEGHGNTINVEFENGQPFYIYRDNDDLLGFAALKKQYEWEDL